MLGFVVEDCAHQGVDGIVSLTACLSKLIRRGGLGSPHWETIRWGSKASNSLVMIIEISSLLRGGIYKEDSTAAASGSTALVVGVLL